MTLEKGISTDTATSVTLVRSWMPNVVPCAKFGKQLKDFGKKNQHRHNDICHTCETKKNGNYANFAKWKKRIASVAIA
eukprot:11437434-Karenia_brevis.AAC.1